MRTETRQFAAQMSERVQRTADAIAVAGAEDPALQAVALKWKLGTSVAGRRAAFRNVPRLALVDTWTFAAQMDAFFRTGNGRELFGARHADAANEAAQIAKDARTLAERHLGASQMGRYDKVVAEQVSANPLSDLEFVRAAVPLSALGEGAPGTVGSAPEVVADASERLDAYGQSIPDETRWRAQILFLDSGLKAGDMAQLATRTDETLRRLADLAEAQPPKIAAFVDDARADLQRGWVE